MLSFRKPEENPLDLNNLPEEYAEQYDQEGKQATELKEILTEIDDPLEPKNTRSMNWLNWEVDEETKNHNHIE